MRRFLDVGSEEEFLLPGPLDLRMDTTSLFLHGGLLRTLCTAQNFEIDLDDLRQRTIEAVELITPHMLIDKHVVRA
jgi:hypothetical protein